MKLIIKMKSNMILKIRFFVIVLCCALFINSSFVNHGFNMVDNISSVRILKVPVDSNSCKYKTVIGMENISSTDSILIELNTSDGLQILHNNILSVMQPDSNTAIKGKHIIYEMGTFNECDSVLLKVSVNQAVGWGSPQIVNFPKQ